jgi:N12 class adenine-specific DNA methylase
MYGNERETTCEVFPDVNLSEQLAAAIRGIRGSYEEQAIDEQAPDESRIPADPTVPNFSFAVRDGCVYFRRDHWMERCDLNAMEDKRVRGMILLRDLTRELIGAQLAGASDEAINALQTELNERYDSFTRQYDLLSSRRNASVFGDDDGYYLLSSLEILDDEHKLERKADMFYRRTIAQNRPVEHADTAPEALAVSMAERARVDLDFMADLTGMDRDRLIADLTGLIFQDPRGNPGVYDNGQTAEESLSGDVRQKLRVAESAVDTLSDRYAANVEALKAVQPKDLEPHEIDVRLGAKWIPPEDITNFSLELLKTPRYMQWKIKAQYAALTGVWHIDNKGMDSSNPFAHTQYGTEYRSGYKIIEESLNLRDVRVFDTIIDENGNEKRVLNQKQTILAQQKQTAIREAFRDWIWKDPRRRERLCRLYNDTYNCIRPREYDGSHLRFSGMNPELSLRPHQKNAVARVLYGGNTLLAHTVGAGKTAVMVAALMEKIRIGLGHKALIAVPNHLTEQTAAEFLRFFPAAKVLVATKKDFEKQNRKRFMGRIATGDYDAIIMGHSQFEKIPVSQERQKQMLEDQIQEIMDGIEEIKESRGERFSIKELERTKKSLEARLKKLNGDDNKDQVVTFEELGVDMLFVDEAHSYKNLAVITKMRNVAGISTTEAKKSSDMYMKCRYLSEITGDRGVVFATGTPISNSMTELYTMQRYLQHTELARRGLAHFDSWAATFGETQTAIELAPEGTGYRMKTRFSKFFNLPELMSMFKQVADIQTPDMLNLPVPLLKGGKTLNFKTEASDIQKEMVASLAERADAVRGGNVDPHEDNMLKITNDGRLLALDARLIDPALPDNPESKVNACVREALRIYEEGEEERLTQLIFCDLSTPKAERTDGGFDDVYHDLKRKLIRAGVPEGEIVFIHDANTEVQKDELFAKVRKGAIRILIGSTAKMGAGTNVQKRLKALHHLDCPWRPSDLQQRDGRILRQGNDNPEGEVIRYITQDTFDAYSYQLVENKQKFISQIFTSKTPMRGAEDLDEMALSYAEVKALAAGNPAIREKMDLDVQVSRLKLLKANWQSERYRLEKTVHVELPGEIARLKHRIEQITKDIAHYQQHKPPDEDGFSIVLMDRPYEKRVDAGERLMKLLALVQIGDSMKVGGYCGFDLRLRRPDMLGAPKLEIDGAGSYALDLGDSALGNIQRLENLAKGLAASKEQHEARLEVAKNQLAGAKAELERPWPQEPELREKSERLTQLNIELNVGGSDASAMAFEEEDEPEAERTPRLRAAVR